jgi:hypothetical protein
MTDEHLSEFHSRTNDAIDRRARGLLAAVVIALIAVVTLIMLLAADTSQTSAALCSRSVLPLTCSADTSRPSSRYCAVRSSAGRECLSAKSGLQNQQTRSPALNIHSPTDTLAILVSPHTGNQSLVSVTSEAGCNTLDDGRASPGAWLRCHTCQHGMPHSATHPRGENTRRSGRYIVPT